MIETKNTTITTTLKPFTTRLPAHIIELIEKESRQDGRSIQRVVSDIFAAHYENQIGK